MSFLHKELGETEKKQIEQKAEKIIEDFSKQLSELERGFDFCFEYSGSSTREEGPFSVLNPEFRKVVFKNAKNKNEEFIIAEKKKW